VAVDLEAHRRFRVAEALREHLRHDPVVVPIVARHERELPQLVSFDADDSLRDRLDEAVAVRSAILRQIARPISNGFSKTEIAKRLGTSPQWVSHRLDELRSELERLST
jgi:DNA-binding NarL/FixJ family response regulator